MFAEVQSGAGLLYIWDRCPFQHNSLQYELRKLHFRTLFNQLLCSDYRYLSFLHKLLCNFIQSLKTVDQLLLATSLSCMGSLLSIFFLSCEYGCRVNTAMHLVNESFYNISWHDCPTGLQKYVVSMLLITQRDVHMRGIFTLDASRETFKRVIYIVFTHFHQFHINFANFL